MATMKLCGVPIPSIWGNALLCAAFLLGPAASPSHAQQADAAVTPLLITLDEAIQRAQKNEPVLAAAIAESKSAGLDRSIARAAMLPTAVYHNQALYTQPNGLQNQAGQTGSQPSPRFIANNAVREYASQGVVTETLSLQQTAALKHADAAALRLAAEAEIARRGLVTTVVTFYYGALAADHKQEIAARSLDEATAFTSLTQKRETAREAAHADVVKAQLEEQQRQRDVSDAELAKQKARLELAVLLFSDPRTPYNLQSTSSAPALPVRSVVESAAGKNNPELRSALASLKESDADVQAARAAYLPDLGLNFIYGIDAPQFAANGPDRVHNLGYAASVTVDIPVWDWLATQHKVRQSEIRRDAVKVALTAAQKRVLVDLNEFYAEASAAQKQLESLDASVQTASESLRLTKLRYAGGETTVLEVVDAQNALILAENAREDGALRYQAALANLQTLTGTL